MNLVKLGSIVALVVGCSGSNHRVPATVYEARDGVDAAGTRLHAKVRPVVRSVTTAVDRTVARGARSAGLHVGSSKN
jgi:hypothetical protein